MPSRIGYKHKEDTKAKIKKYQPNRIMILVTDIITKVETTYDSLAQASRALNSTAGNITRYFTRDQKTPYKKRYI